MILLWNSCTAIIGPKFFIGIITFPSSNQPSTEREGAVSCSKQSFFDVEITIPFSLTKFSIDNEVLPIPLTSYPIRKFSFYFFNKQVVNFTAFHLIKNRNEIPHLFN
ncbi:hypothetical protein ACB092_04G140300 [Castanea dentata]